MKIDIKMDKNDMNLLQASMYMENSKRDVLTYVLGNKFMSINEELFKKYCDEYTVAYMEHECYKGEITKKYLSELYQYIPPSVNISWNVDFSTEYMTTEFYVDDSVKHVLEEAGYHVYE